jgi:hypothetical protein
MSPVLCRFSDAGMRRLSTRCGRRPKSANARIRGKYGTRQCSECYGDRLLVAAISMVDAAPARGDVHVRMQVSPGECNGHLGGHTEFIIQMVTRGRNSTSHNHCAIDRSICVRWHGVNQSLARGNIHGSTFKQTGLRYSSRRLCHCVSGVDVTRRIRVPACQMILAVLNHALHADNT